MPSLYKVIKNNSVIEKHERVINTEFEEVKKVAVNENNELAVRTFVSSYESLSKSMVENARKQCREMLIKTYEEIDDAEKKAEEERTRKAAEAYEEAFNNGYKEGKEKGYEEAYTKNLAAANAEIEIMMNNANNILFQSRKEYDNYLEEKEQQIKDVIFDICRNVLKREVKDTDGLNSMIYDAISEIKGCSSFIIRCHPIHEAGIKEKVEAWKLQLGFRGDIFVLGDESVDEGTAVINMDSGKIITGVDLALTKISEIIANDSAK